MALIRELFRPDLAMLPIGGHFTMDPVGAALATELLGVQHVLPIHWGTFPILTGTPQQLAGRHRGPRRDSARSTPGSPATRRLTHRPDLMAQPPGEGSGDFGPAQGGGPLPFSVLAASRSAALSTFHWAQPGCFSPWTFQPPAHGGLPGSRSVLPSATRTSIVVDPSGWSPSIVTVLPTRPFSG